MARNQGESAATLSVLDRLIDADPQNAAEALPTRAQSLRQIKASLRRDLEWLLNTRRIAVEPPESLREVQRSIYVYGLPDLSGYSMSSPKDQARLLRMMQSAVKLFESRLSNLRIVLLDSAEPRTHTLHFRIDGLLLVAPAPEHISFDTVLELTSGEYGITGGTDAG